MIKNSIWKTFKTSILNNNNSFTDPLVVGTFDREKCPLTDICTPRFGWLDPSREKRDRRERKGWWEGGKGEKFLVPINPSLLHSRF